jgi:hypothetical protein
MYLMKVIRNQIPCFLKSSDMSPRFLCAYFWLIGGFDAYSG